MAFSCYNNQMELQFFEISLISLMTVIIAGLTHILRQPLIIAYLITGILVSPYGFGWIQSREALAIFSEMGVSFLLFMVGLNLSPKIIKGVGRIALLTGVGQVLFTSLVGYIISLLLGFDLITSLYIAIALTFSSTIVIMKLISDKGHLDTLYGRISIGFLIVQDIIAMILLMILSSFNNEKTLTQFLSSNVIIGILMMVAVLYLGFKGLKKPMKIFAGSQELLLIFSIGWCLAVSAAFSAMGFSLEIGALLAGMSLSLSPYKQDIHAKIKPLRDFFLVLFFVYLGAQMTFTDMSSFILPIAIFSFFILIGNPLIVMIIMGVMGYRRHTGFMCGLTVAQISEFSFILIALGVKVGHLDPSLLSLITFIGLITIAGSSYFIIHAEKIYHLLSPYLKIFEKEHLKNKNTEINQTYDVIILGFDHLGIELLKMFESVNTKYIIIDYNPSVIEYLQKMNIPCFYGDVHELEVLESLPFKKCKMVISTIMDEQTNDFLLKYLKRKRFKPTLLLHADHHKSAMEYYNKGATYVITPEVLSGDHLLSIISKHGLGDDNYHNEAKLQRQKIGNYLKHRML
jgi:Kef-type K+ transport system membrane component KefB